jgi:hypothetical protein
MWWSGVEYGRALCGAVVGIVLCDLDVDGMGRFDATAVVVPRSSRTRRLRTANARPRKRGTAPWWSGTARWWRSGWRARARYGASLSTGLRLWPPPALLHCLYTPGYLPLWLCSPVLCRSAA